MPRRQKSVPVYKARRERRALVARRMENLAATRVAIAEIKEIARRMHDRCDGEVT